MKYSVIVPVYNAEKHLRRCIDSVIAQTFSDWELLLVNDGSSDVSPMLCDEYHKKYPDQIQVVHQDNCGVLCARRVGLGHAQGEYLCFLDSDDYWDSPLLEEMDSFQKTYDPDMVVFGYRRVGLHGEVLGEESPTDTIRLYESEEMLLVYEMIPEGKQLSCLWAQVVKRSIVDFDRDYSSFYKVFKGEDLLQNLAFLDKASKVLFVPTIYYSYFINVEGLSHRKITISYLNSHVIVQGEILAYMEKWGMPTQKTYQMAKGIFTRALKAFMLNSFVHPEYSSVETNDILVFLTTGIRYEYLDKIIIDWSQKRVGLCLWLLKRGKIRSVKWVLCICRILNVIKKLIRYSSREGVRKVTNVKD